MKRKCCVCNTRDIGPKQLAMCTTCAEAYDKSAKAASSDHVQVASLEPGCIRRIRLREKDGMTWYIETVRGWLWWDVCDKTWYITTTQF